jgi:hypothetical protein
MRLIDDDEVDGGPLAPGERLSADDLDGRACVGHPVLALHDTDASESFVSESDDALIDERQRGDDEGDPLPLR